MKSILRLSVALAFVCLTISVQAVAYWNCSSPTGPASGTWNNNSTNLTWNQPGSDPGISSTGGPVTSSPLSWLGAWGSAFSSTPLAAAFSLGSTTNGVPGAFTITVDNGSGQVEAADLLVYNGPMTLTGGRLDFTAVINNTPSSASEEGLVFTIHPNQTAYFNVNMTNTVGPTYTESIGRNVFVNKQLTGTLYFGATNTFVGDVAVKSGILGITCDQSIPSASSLILLNGTDIGGAGDHLQDTPPVFNTGGHNQTFDQLVLAGPNSLIPRTINFGNGNGSLVFAGDSSTNAWASTASLVFGDSNPGNLSLVITNYQIGKSLLRFGTTSSGLTATQLSQINFANYTNSPAQIDSLGYVSPKVTAISIVSITKGYNLIWNAIVGSTYIVQYSSNVSGPWLNLATVTALSNPASYFDAENLNNARFYRVILQ